MNLEPLSYFFGAWLGDGYTRYTEALHYQVGIKCCDREILTRCYFEVHDFFTDLRKARFNSVKPYKPGDQWQDRITWNNKDFCLFVRGITSFKEHLPGYIWTASKEAQLAMLAGLLDTDGSISKEPGDRYRLRFTGTLEFVRQVPELFNCTGIKTSKVSEEYPEGNQIRYYFYPEIKSAVEAGFYFRCRRKQYRLEQYAAAHKLSYNYPHDWISDMERGDPTRY